MTYPQNHPQIVQFVLSLYTFVIPVVSLISRPYFGFSQYLFKPLLQKGIFYRIADP